MDTQLLVKIIHMSAAGLAIVAILARAITLFVDTQGNQPNPKARVFLVALQHLVISVIALTGIIALFLKNFDVQPWFYAKIILFLVLISSLGKAYKKDDSILLVQRRAGLFIAVVSLIAIMVLVMIKPNFG
ncbi:SirB2 family protein [Acinetobacter variabilis]|uniref:SirB2 family protein n=1 Tax=Acinetobacter TaxID=469 RepID=UPI000EF0AD15|nr:MULTISPECIES: SirB2 family protein [Acinetobacter]HAB42831.1 invasion protein expression up-regulator SirB [Acinetobacter sp.]NHB65629.1 SirB2 family protein [Acinetobacter sp. GFQ9D191M]NHB99001.1 SirB2 family protein [Acinetobacter sp. GFQ9D192M]UNW07121.1 SirB2 family protein [Acinetobacter variabilis]WPC34762.1 SirB2 family protein [Acinetobacter sp. YWS30-1]